MIKKIFLILVVTFILMSGIKVDAKKNFTCEYVYDTERRDGIEIMSFSVIFTYLDDGYITVEFKNNIIFPEHFIIQPYVRVIPDSVFRLPSSSFSSGTFRDMISEECYVCPQDIHVDLTTIREGNDTWDIELSTLTWFEETFTSAEAMYLVKGVYSETTNTCPYPYNDYNLSPSFPTENSGCFSASINQILTFCGTYIFTPIRWIVPIALILITSFDLAKAVFVKVEDGMKKAKDNFIKRALIALIIFLAPTIVTVVLNLVASVVGDDQCITDVDLNSVNSNSNNS